MAHPNLVFMGVCGCGKSTVAEIYAQRTGATLLEADGFHPPENIAKMSGGTPLTDADRAGWLAAMAARLTEGKARGEAMVVTCSALKKVYRDRLREGDPSSFSSFSTVVRSSCRRGSTRAKGTSCRLVFLAVSSPRWSVRISPARSACTSASAFRPSRSARPLAWRCVASPEKQKARAMAGLRVPT